MVVELDLNPFMTEADMRGKSMDWFLYDIGLRHERVNRILTLTFGFNNLCAIIIYMFA